MRVETRIRPGAQSSGTLRVSNESSARLRVRAELLDFFIDENGTPQFGPSYRQEAEHSCREWLSVNPMELELDAGSQLPVRYTLRVPPAAGERSYHCGVGFTTLPTASEIKGMGLRVAVRAVASFYPIVGNPKIDGELREVTLEFAARAKPPRWQAVAVLENRGWMLFRPSGELVVLGEDGRVIESHPFVPLPVLPQRRQRFLFPLERIVNESRYTLRARVDIGSGEIQEGSTVVVARTPAP